MTKKLTPWFKPEIDPVHIGVYERVTTPKTGRLRFSFWNGRMWLLSGFSVIDACDHDNERSSEQNTPWRGLAEPPK